MSPYFILSTKNCLYIFAPKSKFVSFFKMINKQLPPCFMKEITINIAVPWLKSSKNIFLSSANCNFFRETCRIVVYSFWYRWICTFMFIYSSLSSESISLNFKFCKSHHLFAKRDDSQVLGNQRVYRT